MSNDTAATGSVKIIHGQGEGQHNYPVAAISALPAERFPKGRIAVVDCLDQMHEEAKGVHPSLALMAQDDPAAAAEDMGSYALLLINGLPQMYDTHEKAIERVRFLQHAAKHGAMLTLGGLKRMVEQMEKSGVPMTSAVCVPVMTENAGMCLIRLGGGTHLRLQAQHVMDGVAIDENKMRDLVVFDAGVFPPMSAGMEHAEAELAVSAGNDSVGQ